MKRTVKIVALTAIVGMLASSAVVAGGASTPWLTSPTYEGQTYRRPGMATDGRPVRMPGIASRGDSLAGQQYTPPAASAGPSLTGDDLISPRGGALVAPTGSGPMYTPKQQGDRQIGQLIKQLG